MTTDDRSRALHWRDPAGQAALEFFFILIAMVMIMGLLVTLFSFAQGTFKETSRVRAEMLATFHKDRQFEIAEKIYKPANQLEVQIRRLPYVGRLVAGVRPYRRSIQLEGGTRAPLIIWWQVAECGAAAGLVLTQTRTMLRRPWGEEVSTAIGTGICAAKHFGE